MKKWFRRLSSKELKPAGSYDHNEYSSSNRLDIAQGVGASNSVNPALSAAKLRETAPEQRHSNSSVERDLQLSQNAAFECYLAESVPQSSSAPARRLSSGALGSTGYASASAPSNHRQQDTRGHKQRLSGSIYDSSDADSILSTQHDVHQRYKPLQDTTHQSQHAALTSHRSGCSSASGTSRHGRPEHSVQYSNSIPQSIYRSHDLDILSSGGQAFDRDPILSTAPSADWLWEETVQRQPPTHQPGSQRHYRARAHHRAQYSPKPPRAKHADFLPSPRNSVRLTDVLSRAPSMPPQQKHGMHIPSIHERFDTQHAASPIVTPFAKHAHGSTGRSMGSQDLDTAMRGAARAYSHQVGMQANGSLGADGTLQTAMSADSTHSNMPPKEMDFRYSPMKASLRSRSLESTRSIIQDKDSVPDFPLNTGQTNGTTPSRQLHTSQPQSSVTGHRPHNGFSVIQATGSPSGLSAVTRQLSASSRHTIMPSSTLASNAAQHDKALSSPSRRSSFDSTHSNSHSPARHPLIPSTERPSSMWSQLASPPTAPAASAPQVNRSPTRAAYRTAQLMARQHSMRSSVSSLPDIDEDNNSFTSTRTDESIVAPNTHHSPHQTPPSSAKQAQHLAPPGHLQHLHSVGQLQASQNSSRQTNLLVSRRLLPEFHEQPNASGPSSAAVQTAQTAGPQTDQTAALQRVQHAGTQTDQNAQQASGNTAADTALQTQPSKELAAAQANRFTVSEVVSAVDDSPQQPQVLGIAAEPAHPGSSSSQQVQEAHRQIEQALQAAEQQVAALRNRVTKKHSQLADARHQLEVSRGELRDVCASQHRAPPSLPDTESSEQTDIAAAEIQLLRQALDKLQSETQNIDDELAKAREQAIFSELERAELRHELETVTAQLQACEATKAELESTISKLLSDVKGHRVLSKPALLRSESPASSQSLGRSLSASSQFMRSISANADQKDVTGLENEIDILKFELESTKARMESEIAKAREEALSVMKATGDADAEVRRLMTESVDLTSAQQEAEADLQLSQQSIADLQAALRTAQLTMLNHKSEQEQAQATISCLRLQQQQQQRQHQLDSQHCLSVSEAAELTQRLAELNKQNSDLGSNNAELSTDLGRALDVAQRVMEQKQSLQQQCRSQQDQLSAEQRRVKDLEGFAEEAMTALEGQAQENANLRQQLVSAVQRASGSSSEPALVSSVS